MFDILMSNYYIKVTSSYYNDISDISFPDNIVAYSGNIKSHSVLFSHDHSAVFSYYNHNYDIKCIFLTI